MAQNDGVPVEVPFLLLCLLVEISLRITWAFLGEQLRLCGEKMRHYLVFGSRIGYAFAGLIPPYLAQQGEHSTEYLFLTRDKFLQDRFVGLVRVLGAMLSTQGFLRTARGGTRVLRTSRILLEDAFLEKHLPRA
jgi:hypothetical protein